ncbi:hypothetical protein [Mucilaginibacter phyllosphaerae]|uniref:Lipoprotein n=1 Tax=Mucilaginibacter phyllosphaerae TaxID=1812349 RepID=A0A4Y8A778_9SPHI|nr:hypothetical protein [Mucilaginibacter phyllosphaerae]MBB3970822.1 hypothetical protein [Mucilaginibacter phyllosphaerae]TEW64240.1 hypothetical protein E2R65_17990 [Mucilaginibacter phyllosphaerae]GGH04824.1 hypothetical protein GCM10007352_08250 [Mucilaginibacter phyllosphaerae]
MKKTAYQLMILAALASCKSKTNNATQADTAINKAEVSKTSPDAVANNTPVAIAPFDINSIPVTDKDPGKFPYLGLPDKYTFDYHKEASAASINNMDKEYFAVNGKLIPQEGKTFKTHIELPNAEGKFSSMVVSKYYNEAIKALGGVQVNHVAVPKTQIDSVGNNELVDKKYGYSIDYNLLDDIKTYVIRTKTKQIWIQMTLMNEESGKLTVLEKAN